MNISMAFFAQGDHIKIVFPFVTKIMMVFFRLIFAKSTNKCIDGSKATGTNSLVNRCVCIYCCSIVLLICLTSLFSILFSGQRFIISFSSRFLCFSALLTGVVSSVSNLVGFFTFVCLLPLFYVGVSAGFAFSIMLICVFGVSIECAQRQQLTGTFAVGVCAALAGFIDDCFAFGRGCGMILHSIVSFQTVLMPGMFIASPGASIGRIHE